MLQREQERTRRRRMENVFLFCFINERFKNEIFNILSVETNETEQSETIGDNGRYNLVKTKHKLNGHDFYATVFDTDLDNEYVEKLKWVCTHNNTPVLFVDGNIFSILRGHLFRSRVTIFNQGFLSTKYNVQLESRQVDRLNEELRRCRVAVTPEVNEGGMLTIFLGLMMREREPVFLENAEDQEDDAFLVAQTRSLNQEQPTTNALEPRTKRLKLQPSWESVLKQSEHPKSDFDPICMVCQEHKATICFVQCSHQVACDECVRIYFSNANSKRECFVCREYCETIIRPIYSASKNEK